MRTKFAFTENAYRCVTSRDKWTSALLLREDR